MIDLRKETLTLAEARDQLHDAIWPGAQYQLGTPDKSKAKKDPDTGRMLTGALKGYTLDLLEDRMAEIDSEILAALRRDDLCIRYERGGMWRNFDRNYWRSMEDQSALVLVSLGRMTVSDNGIGRDLPLTLVRREFDEFKGHVMNGNPERLVDLSDALAFIAAGMANEAAAMRWRCELKRVYGRTGWAIPHSEQFELALRDLNKGWRAGAALPIAQRPDKPGYDEKVSAELADICELRPYGLGHGKIESKNVYDRSHDREWINVRFQFGDVARLCLMGDESAVMPYVAPVADPIAETHWTIPQCIAWIAARNTDGVSRATNSLGLRALAGAMGASGLGNFGASRAQLLKGFRTGLTCLAINRRTGEPENIPLSQRAHIQFDLEHNAALIEVEMRWYDLKFPVEEVLKAWPSAEKPEIASGVILAPQKTRARSLPAQKADQEARIKQVIAKAKRQWPDPKKAPPFQAMAVELCSSDRTGKCVDYSIETTRKILEGRYRPQQRAAISGYID